MSKINNFFPVSPACMSGQQRIYAVAKHEEVNVSCEVDADPDDVTFRWIFNNTSETLDVITFITMGTRSIAPYTPRSRIDYGTLSCWGRNSIGVQRQPCVFSIVPAGKYHKYIIHTLGVKTRLQSSPP